MRQPIPSLAQLEQTARLMIRAAYAQGWRSDELVEDYVAEQMGHEHRALIVRVHASDFKSFPP
jgi:hypothetical protein